MENRLYILMYCLWMAPTVVLKSVLFICRCDICSATFNLQKNLALHVAAHQTENLICPGKQFKWRIAKNKVSSEMCISISNPCFKQACANFSIFTHNTYRYLLIRNNCAFADKLIFSKVGI